MASPHDPLLLVSSPSTKDKPHGKACKLILLSSTLAAVLCLAALGAVQVTTDQKQSHPADLCAFSPNLSSCQTVVSDVLAAGNSQLGPHSTADLVQVLIRRSLRQLDAAAVAAGGIQGRLNGSGRKQAALADCVQLMDVSRDRLVGADAAVGSSSLADAHSWLSAVLTNYVTCLDGLDGDAREDLAESHVKPLMELASASLAVLVTMKPNSGDDQLTKLVFTFPSWVSTRDRKLLAVDPQAAKAVQANVVVAQDGSGKYKTLQAAVDAAPDKSASRYVIYVKKGVYKETVRLSKQKTNIMIVGDGQDATIITGSLNFIDGTTTFESATLAAAGDGFILQDIRIQNTAGPQKHQAVALRVSADKAVINRCKIEAYQDTLYTHTLRQFYRDSTISGTVDFIFGDAGVVFQNCDLVARKPMSNQQNLVTAQGRTDPNQNTGTSIQNCRVVPSADLAPLKGTIPSYLGRPWKEYSRTVFLQSDIDGHIAKEGWKEWEGSFALRTLYYGEYANRGAGAGTAARVKWPGYHVITDAKVAQAFTVGQLIQGGAWLKGTGVAYTEGL
ncbi:hypothetical protein Taro_055641 [Colocasia esculenta]|uniref:Pectinesterase n=1 Tax=Colocasia esculenta TaxID=4460 RepID=A0A843XTJ1_COLES|nr:hypothetical protein [Colocasia esculenta]